MSRTKETPVQEFNLTVPLRGVILKNGDRVKYLRVEIDQREYWIKIPKPLRPIYDPNQWQPGTVLQISGVQTIDRKTGVLELEATTWQGLETATTVTETIPIPKPAQILICGKKDCWQAGGKDIYQCLEQEIIDRGLQEKVRLHKTGCQKQCKHAPNLVTMPSKKRYQSVSSSQTLQILLSALENSPDKTQ